MQRSTARTENIFAELLTAIKNYQQQSIYNDSKQMEILSNNTAQIVTKTTDELKIINETFNREVMGELQTSLKTFAATTEKNISVQRNLSDSTAQISKIILQADESILRMQSVMKKFGKFSDDALNHLEEVTENFSAEVKKINDVALGVAHDTEEYLKNFNTASADSMKVIRETISRPLQKIPTTNRAKRLKIWRAHWAKSASK